MNPILTATVSTLVGLLKASNLSCLTQLTFLSFSQYVRSSFLQNLKNPSFCCPLYKSVPSKEFYPDVFGDARSWEAFFKPWQELQTGQKVLFYFSRISCEIYRMRTKDSEFINMMRKRIKVDLKFVEKCVAVFFFVFKLNMHFFCLAAFIYFSS